MAGLVIAATTVVGAVADTPPIASADTIVNSSLWENDACVNGTISPGANVMGTTSVSNPDPANGSRVRVTTTIGGYPSKVTFTETSDGDTSYRYAGINRAQVGWSGVPVVDWGPRENSYQSGTSIVFSPPPPSGPDDHSNRNFESGTQFWVEYDAPAPGTAYQPPGGYLRGMLATDFDTAESRDSTHCWTSPAQISGSLVAKHDDPSNTSTTFAAGEEFDIDMTIAASGTSVHFTSTPNLPLYQAPGLSLIQPPLGPFPVAIAAGTEHTFTYRVRANAAGDFEIETYPYPKSALGGYVNQLPLTLEGSVALGYVVNSDGDAADDNLGDGVCDTGDTVVIEAADVVECTLRAAIGESNANAGADRIEFDISGTGVPTIAPVSPLPVASGPITIDASTQEAGNVVLSGSAIVAGEPVDGLVLDGQDGKVQGLAIVGFSGAGVVLRGTGSHDVVGNLIGVGADGTTAAPNARAGIVVESPANIIGGAGVLANTIAHNFTEIETTEPEPGTTAEEATATFADLSGNILIGANGGAQVGYNTLGAGPGVIAYGPIAASGVDIHDNTITSELAIAAVYADGSVGRVQVRHNTIGNAGGDTSIGAVLAGGGAGRTTFVDNTLVGVTIGALVAGIPATAGLDITGNEFGDTKLALLSLGTSAMAVVDNVIGGDIGVLALGDGTSKYGDNEFRGNTISSDIGLLVVAEQDDVIADNTFTDSGKFAAMLVAVADSSFTGNQVDTDVGVLSLGPSLPAFGENKFNDNRFDGDLGLFIIGENGDEVIGNTFTGPGNSVDDDTGIAIFMSTAQASRINDNTIGDTTIGMLLANVGGADIFGNTITNTNAAALVVADEPTDRDLARADAAGADVDSETLFDELLKGVAGDSALAWANGAQDLVEIDHNVIYQSAISGARNEWMRNTITDNDIGVILAGAVNANQFGEDDLADLSNLITRNDAAGLLLTGTPGPQDVTVRRNAIYGNGTLGNDVIPSGVPDFKLVPVDDADSHAPDPDIWEQIPNDAGDADAGPNGLQNHPIITGVAADGSEVHGELWSKPNSSYVIDVYASNVCHISGTGGGQFYLGTVPATTDGSGRGTFTLDDISVGPGQFATATATKGGLVDGATSEFSRCAARGTIATVVTSPAAAGDDRIDVEGQAGFEVGDEVIINPGGDNEETQSIAGFGSIIFGRPLAFAHAPGEPVVRATSSGGTTAAMVPLVPARLLETRRGPSEVTADHLFEGDGRVVAKGVVELVVAGRGGVPDDASAVMLNVTAVSPDAPGFVTAYPCGAERPQASNVNYGPGDVVPNAVLAKVGDGGKVCLFSRAATDLIVDVNGYVPSGGSVETVVPARILETRQGPTEVTVDHQFEGDGRVAAGGVVELVVAGRGGAPANVGAVFLNVTVVSPDAPGFVTVYPCGSERPKASNLNYGPGAVVPNAVLADVGDGGKVCLFSRSGTDLIVDLNGYVPSGSTLGTMVPARLLETRQSPTEVTVDHLFEGGGRVDGGQVAEVIVTDRGGVPANASAVFLNVTAVLPDAPGFVTVYPCGSERPTASNLNYGRGDVRPNAVLAKVGDGGKVCLFTRATTDLIVDVNGFVSQTPG